MTVRITLEPPPHQESDEYPELEYLGVPEEEARKLVEGFANRPDKVQYIQFDQEPAGDRTHYAVIDPERVVQIRALPTS